MKASDGREVAIMTPKMRQPMTIAGFALLAVLAVAGWTRNPDPASTSANSFQSPVNHPVYGQGMADLAPAYGHAQPVAGQNCNEPLEVHRAMYAPPAAEPVRYRAGTRQTSVRRVVEDRNYVVRRNKRSTRKSVAIVAGSAGAGAAIGALAGGGKGAAIGGLSGGVAGLVYDRLTHNR